MLHKSKLSFWMPNKGSGFVPDTAQKNMWVIGDSISRASSKNNTDPERWATSVTKANPGVVTQTGRLMVAGNDCFVWGAKGMIELNETVQPVVAVGTNTLSIGDTTAFGTHITDSGYFIQEKGAVLTHLAQGMTSPLNQFTNQRFAFNPRWNRGYSGDRTDTVRGRLDVSLPPSLIRPKDVVSLIIGTNDVGTTTAVVSRSYSDIMADVAFIVDYITNTLGAYCLLYEVPPNGNNTTAQQDLREQLNAGYATLASNMCFLVPIYGPSVDPATRGWKAGLSYDQTHPTSAGGQVWGRVAAIVSDAKFGIGAWSLNAGNMIVNPTLSGLGGTLNGVLATNNGIATGWTITGVGNGAQSTRIARKNPVNDGQELETNYPSGLLNGERIYCSQNITTGLTIGAKYCMEALLEISADNGTGAWYELSAELRNQGSVFSTDNHRRNSDPMSLSTYTDFCSGGRLVHLKTLPVEYLSSWTSLSVRINMGMNCVTVPGAGRMTVRGVQVYPV